MIVAAGTTGTDKLLLIGLSRENTERLLAGQPIPIDASKFGLPGVRVFLMAGETEDTMRSDLAAHGALTAATEIHDNR